jgi:predicted DCC family thiol-disulfide oxidoreductase YuxK
VTIAKAESDARKLVANPVVRLFATADLRSLALMRVALGVLLIGDLLPRIAEVDALYSNEGVLTNHYALFRPLVPYQFSFYFAASSTRDVTVLFLLTLAIYVFFTVGYRTRIFHILSFVCVTSLHARNLLAELPSDAVLHVSMAWSLFLPLGARFSVDRLRQSLSDRREKAPSELNERPGAPIAFSSVAVLGIVLQLAAMHIAAFLRQTGPTWSDGTALYYALHHNLFTSGAGASFGKNLPLDTVKLLTAAYRHAQLIIGVLVLVPVTLVRRISVVLLLLFHLGSWALFRVGPYDIAVLGTLPLLLSARDWAALGSWYARQKRELVVYFDADCGICLMICRWLVRFDALERLTFAANVSADAPPEVQAVAEETVVTRDPKTGRIFTKSRALAAILASLPFGGVPSLILGAPGIAQVADFGYDLVAKNRAAISVWLGFQACGVPHAPSAAAARRAAPWRGLANALATSREFAAAVFLFVCGTALWHDTLPEGKAPNLVEPLTAAIAYPRIFQKWGLFAPDPPKDLGAVVVEAWNGRGSRFDPLTDDVPRESLELEWKADGPRRPSPLFSAYFVSISQPARALYLDGLKDYVSRIGDERPPADRPTAYTVSWMETPIAPPEGESASPAGIQVLRRRLTARP